MVSRCVKQVYRLRKILIHVYVTDSNHVDLWIGTDTNGGATQITCEQDLGTTNQNILINPPSGLEVNAQNLWDGTCHTTDNFPGATSSCSGGGSGSTDSASSAAPVAPPPASSSTPSAPQVSTPPPTQPTSTAPQQPVNAPGRGFVQNKAVVQPQPTTLQTLVSSVASSNEPTNTPLPTANGVCETAGAAVCSADGKQIGICNTDKTVIFMHVAAGTKCKDGAMVFADA